MGNNGNKTRESFKMVKIYSGIGRKMKTSKKFKRAKKSENILQLRIK